MADPCNTTGMGEGDGGAQPSSPAAMTPEEAARRQAAYEHSRRAWAEEIGRPIQTIGRGHG